MKKKGAVKKGNAPHATQKKNGFDKANEYAPFAKTKIGGKK